MVMERERSKLLLLDYPNKGEQLNITLDVDNWKDWEVSAKRDGFSDTFLETSFPFHFVRFAREAIKSLFDRFGVSAFATVRLIPYNDAMPSGQPPYNYAEAIDYDLDFISYKEKGDRIEINVRTKDLRSLIKEQEGTVYDFEVYRIRERRPLVLKRLVLDNVIKIKYQDVFGYDKAYQLRQLRNPDQYLQIAAYVDTHTMNMSIIDVDARVKDHIMTQNVDSGKVIDTWSNGEDFESIWSLKALASGKLKFNFKQTIYSPTYQVVFSNPNPTARNNFINAVNGANKIEVVFEVVILPRENNRSIKDAGRVVARRTVNLYAEDDPRYMDKYYMPTSVLCRPDETIDKNFLYGKSYWTFHTPNFSDEIDVNPGDRIAFLMTKTFPKSTYDIVYGEINNNMASIVFSMCCIDDIEVSYKASNIPVSVDWINPKTVLQVLVDRITKTSGRYKTDIEFINEWNTDTWRLGIVAAESLRNYPNAMLHTSYKNFKQWMLSLGYLECETDKGITYRRVTKATVFNPEINEANVLHINEVSDLATYPTSKMLYTNIKIGYKEVKVETVNGLYEFNGEAQYEIVGSTGKQTLDLTSPYRADSIGMEVLIPYRTDERGTDNKADNDVFVVDMFSLITQKYLVYMTQSVFPITFIAPGVISPLRPGQIDLTGREWFNGNLSPSRLMQRWAEVLLGFGGSLRLASATNLVNTRIYTYNLDDAIFINNGTLHPVTYDFATGNNFELRHIKRNNLISFIYSGEKRYGYVEDIRQNPLWNTEVQWKLLKYDTSPNETIYQLYVEDNIIVDFAQNEVSVRVFANGYKVMPLLTIGELPSWITYIEQTAGDSFIDVKFIVAMQSESESRNTTIKFIDILQEVECEMSVSQEEYRTFEIGNIVQFPEDVKFPISGELQDKSVLLMFFADILAEAYKITDLLFTSTISTQGTTSRALTFAFSIDNVTEKGKVLLRLFYLGVTDLNAPSNPYGNFTPNFTIKFNMKLGSDILLYEIPIEVTNI